MSNFTSWEPGEAVRVSLSWEDWADGETVTDASVTAHPDLTVSEVFLNGFEVTALVSVPDAQPVGSELWVRFRAESGSRKASRTHRVLIRYRPPLVV
jgi:hypothetical protein